jgi:mono/diheme cytochrome c family protein
MADGFRPSAILVAASIGLMTATIWAARLQPAAPQPTTKDLELFESRIRPLLIDNCFSCHTDDQKGGLRLDSRERMLKGGETGPAVVPGDPESSLLIKAVRHVTGVAKMPRGEPKLSDAQIAALTEWIKAGAPWPVATAAPTSTGAAPKTPGPGAGITDEHRAFWSFQPLANPPVPSVASTTWAKTDIDRFILARLEREGLKPVRAADKLTLIRRATLDLTGLPPTFEEVAAFEKDDSPDAFAKVVDRLLASPRYGETWGRLWLDVARFGEDDPRSLDPKGRGYAPYPNAYLYRDWVIKAFNDDVPYDQFVRAQIAGDLLDERTRARMLPALGFLGLGPWYYDNGAVEITRADERHDRVDVVTRGFLGLTVACARCHDHKYDPILAKDYYALAGVFQNSDYHEYPLAPKAVVAEYKAQEKKIEQKEKLLQKFMQTESRQLGETLAFSASKYMQSAWKVTGEPKKDVARVANEDKLDYELLERWIRFLAKPPKFYPYLRDWQAMIKEGGSAADAKKLGGEFQQLLLDVMFEQKEAEEENEIIRAKALPGTKKKKEANLPNEFVTNDDFCPGCGLELKSLPTERMQLWTDLFVRDLEEGVEPFLQEYVRPGLLAFRGWGLERFLSADRRRHVEDLRADIREMKKALPPKFTYVHGVQDAATPENLKIAIRGNPMKLGDEVPRRFLAVLSQGDPPPLTKGSGRLELADIIAKHPITARVIVNRVWKWHFGTGIVDTPSNFGTNGERPTHPELLEYLATFFVSKGMSIKALHREIMLSAVYQLSAQENTVNADKDGGNRLYWRATRRRMTAEQIRDSVLFVSGALDSKVGGPSEELTPAFNRRTVYGKVSRYKLDQYLQLFDFPAATISAEQRFTTSVPLQRLFFMNSDFMQQQGELLARRVASEPDTRARIRKAYQLIYGREAAEAELAAGAAYVAQEPMRAYEERKAEAASRPAGSPDKKAQTTDKDEAEGEQDPEDGPRPMTGDGMMAGVVPGAAGKDEPKLLPVTAFGRYMKILLSSSEFLFVS